MAAPPERLDGATLLRYADLRGVEPTGRTRHVVAGEQRDRFRWLAVAQYDGEQGFYLFYCDDDWRVVTDTLHETLQHALDQAAFEFGDLTFHSLRS